MTKNDPTKLTLAQLGADSPDKVATLFSELRSAFDQDASQNIDSIDLGVTRVKWLGRKSGILSEITEHWLKPASKEVKPAVGQSLNALKSHIEERIAALTAEKDAAGEQSAAARDKIDLSLPGIERAIGTRHLIRQTYDELLRIFTAIGFSVVAGPEIETPYYNFEALNIPEHHPARDNMDTFYIAGARGGHLLRTHTSPMQIRTMENQKPPVRIVVPGKVYRRDNPDATHGYMFHQIEGLAVDTDITFCDFKGTVDYFAREFLGPKTKTRLRPSYFPFTEPSAEVDATCHVCGGSGCRVCKHSGWIELFGAGMVNPAVYGFVGYDPEKYSGFAFGMGVDRLAMMKYGVTEVPLLFQNDMRFLKQFP
ncbi:MAG TPA: phenylalanine--tRNA ligase subunit alpha [Candidatus Acidoferrales bacterium]